MFLSFSVLDVSSTADDFLARTFSCCVTGVCLCTPMLAHLDDILGIHSLDKIRETVEESIACSSLEGRKRAEEGSHDMFGCRSKQ